MNETLQTLKTLKTLSEKVYELQAIAEERLKARHGRFNVFTTLLEAHDEVRLHTRFLQELLNPDGTHDCGNLFLGLFFKTLQEHKALNHEDSVTLETWDSYCKQCYRVGKEERTEQGQLDLILEANTHLLVIENKIWAKEQENQVSRYIEYVKKQTNRQGHVLYLTLDGKAATTHNGKKYLRISYSEHIMAWIERCLQATYSIVPINQILIQYQNVVKQLIGQQLEEESMNEIKDFIRANPKIISQRSAIDQAIKLLRIEVLENFANALADSLSSSFIVTPRTDMKNNSFGADSFGDLKIRSKEYDITADHSFEIWIEHISIWTALVIGIESNWQKKRALNKDEKILLTSMREKLLSHCEKENIHHADAVETWKGTYWPTSWHDLIEPFMADDEEFVKMLNPDYFQSQVDAASTGIRDYMTLLERFYREAMS